MLRRVGAVQLDTISVLARSHELVAYARLGPVPRQRIERAYWHPGRPAAFEYWSHAACVLPIEEWPWYAFRRRALRARGRRWHQSHERTCAEVLARLRAEGPLNSYPAGRGQGGRPVVGLVGHEDRRRVAAGRGRGRLRPPGRLAPGLRPARAGAPRRAARRREDRRGVPGPPGRGGRPGARRGHPGRPDRLPPAARADRRPGRARGTGRRFGAGRRAGPGHHRGGGQAGARLGRPGRAGRAAARPAPGHPALPVRLAGVGPQADPADVRLRAQPGGLRAQGQAGARLLRDAAAGPGPPARPGRPGAPGPDAGRPPAVAGIRGGGRADGPGAARGGRLGRLLRRRGGPGQPAPAGRAAAAGARRR